MDDEVFKKRVKVKIENLCKRMDKMAKYILFDTETTGLEKEDRIIQVGAMIVDDQGDVEVFDELCSTDVPISIDAMSVHGITPNLLEKKGVFRETNFYKTLLSLNNQDNFLIAHNMPFDMGMMEKEGFISQLRIIDTLRVARHLLAEQKSKGLQYLRYALELYKEESSESQKYNISIKAHDAIGDVLVMKLLLSKLTTIIKEKFPDANPMLKMQELTTTPIFIETFRFGKHKGKQIADVYESDKGYIDWMLRTIDLDVDMKYTLDVVMEQADRPTKKIIKMNLEGIKQIRVTGEEEIQGSKAWLEWRKNFRTASNASTVLGVNPFESAVEKKKRELNIIPEVKYDDAMKQGHEREDEVRKMAETYFNTKFTAQCWEYGKYAASLDGIDDESKLVVELKVSAYTYHKLLKGELPQNYKIQVMQQLMCSGAEIGYIVALNPYDNQIAVSNAITLEETFYEQLEQAWNDYTKLEVC